ncbi:hypothetical protein [Pseudanabaena sp. PCC 6802]|nr:hypothetical protein [Pseudanabaena sp. PCC 6802]
MLQKIFEEGVGNAGCKARSRSKILVVAQRSLIDVGKNYLATLSGQP